MEITNAIASLSALAHEHRLRVFRLLVREGPSGVSAGEIAETLGLPASTLSFHLSHLANAGLVSARRHHRQIFYAVEVEQTRQLLAFLTEECCQGRPELCGGLANVGSELWDEHDAPAGCS